VTDETKGPPAVELSREQQLELELVIVRTGYAEHEGVDAVERRQAAEDKLAQLDIDHRRRRKELEREVDDARRDEARFAQGVQFLRQRRTAVVATFLAKAGVPPDEAQHYDVEIEQDAASRQVSKVYLYDRRTRPPR
jgi:hypothetical protein